MSKTQDGVRRAKDKQTTGKSSAAVDALDAIGLEPQLVTGLRTIVTRGAQILECFRDNLEGERKHRRAVDVVNLAIEIARLQGKKEPEDTLRLAANLLLKATQISAEEERKFNKGDKISIEELASHLRANRKARGIPFTEMCDESDVYESGKPPSESAHKDFVTKDGISFSWRKYRGEAEFKKLIAKLVEREWRNIELELKRMLQEHGGEPAKGSRANAHWNDLGLAVIKLLKTKEHWFPLRYEEQYRKVESAESFKLLTSAYCSDGAERSTERLWNLAQSGEMTPETLHWLWSGRQESYRGRGRHAKTRRSGTNPESK